MPTIAHQTKPAIPPLHSAAAGCTDEERILARVYSELGPERYARFFDRQARLSVGPGHLDVTVPTGFTAQLLDRRFGDVLRRAAGAAAARPGDQAGDDPAGSMPVELRFRVDGGAFGRRAEGGGRGADAAPARRPAPERPRRAAPNTPTAARHRLEEFIVGESNRLAFSAAEEVCRPDGARRLTPLFIHGACGMGKTHLLQGIAARCRERGVAAVRSTTAEAFTNEYITAVRANRIEAFRKSYRGVDVLCIDDVHFLSAKVGTQSELLHTFDSLDLGGARVVLASDEHPRAIQKLSDSLASRFMAGMVVRMEPPEPVLREQIVRTLIARNGLAIDEAGARLIAAWPGGAPMAASGSVRDLEGLVMRVLAVMRLLTPGGLDGASINLAAARRALGLGAGGDRPAPARLRRPIPVSTISGEVCRTLGVDYQDLCGRGRHPRVVVARSLTAYLSRRLTTMSFPEIARAMGRPNHSSVITAFRRVEKQIAGNAPLSAEYGGLSLGDLAAQLEDRLVRGALPA